MAQPAFDRSLTSAVSAPGAEPSPDGALRARVEPGTPWWHAEIMGVGGRWQRLHSIRDPLAEARGHASALQIEGRRTIVLLGCGLGYLAEVLLDAVPDLRVVAIEPSSELAHACRNRRNWDEASAAGRFDLRSWPDVDTPNPLWELFDRDEPDPVVAAHPVLEREVPALVARMRARVGRIVFDGRGNAEARRRQAGRYLLNSIRNLGAIAGGADVSILQNAFAGVPAVVVGAGPSLDAHLDSLKALSTKALVIAVDTTLRPLANAGVRPHLAVALDPTDLNARHLIDLPDVRDTWLVAEPSVAPAAIAPFEDRLFTFRVADHHPWPWLTGIGLGRQLLRVWGSVLTAGLDLAIFTGANPITFVGADLAFTGGRPYCRGAIWEQDWAASTGRGQSLSDRFADDLAARPIEHVADLRGQLTPTTPHLLAFREWLLGRMREERGTRFFNASGAGILFGDPIVQESLKPLLERPSVSGIRNRIRTFAFQGDRKTEQQRRAIAAALRRVLDGDNDFPREAWASFGQATVGRDELEAVISGVVESLAIPKTEPLAGAPAPGGLLPAADRAALLRAALVADTSGVVPEAAALGGLSRTFHQLRELLASGALRAGAPTSASASASDHGRVPASLLFAFPLPARDNVVIFEDALARLYGRLNTGSTPGVSADDVGASSQSSPCSLQPSLAAVMLVHEWLSVARLAGEPGGTSDDSIAHWQLSALIAAWSGHGSDPESALQLTIDGAPALPLPNPREWPARELTGMVGFSLPEEGQAPDPTPRLAIRRVGSASDDPGAERDAMSHPWLQLFEGAAMRLVPERLSPTRVGRAGLATTLSPATALVTPVDALASVEIDGEGHIVERAAWPRPIWGEIPYGATGGALAWHNPDRIVLVRRAAGAAAEQFEAPFRPLRVALGPDGVPIWCAFDGGLWRWSPGDAPQRLIDTPPPIHLHVSTDGAVRIDVATRDTAGAAIRRRVTRAWQWRPGASRLELLELGAEGQCTSVESAHGWSALAHPYSDLVLITTPDNLTVRLGIHYPLTAAWAGPSLIVCSGEGEVLLFRDFATRLSGALR